MIRFKAYRKSTGFLWNMLADGAKVFVYRPAVRLLLGIPEKTEGNKVHFKASSLTMRFRRSKNDFWDESVVEIDSCKTNGKVQEDYESVIKYIGVTKLENGRKTTQSDQTTIPNKSPERSPENAIIARIAEFKLPVTSSNNDNPVSLRNIPTDRVGEYNTNPVVEKSTRTRFLYKPTIDDKGGDSIIKLSKGNLVEFIKPETETHSKFSNNMQYGSAAKMLGRLPSRGFLPSKGELSVPNKSSRLICVNRKGEPDLGERCHPSRGRISAKSAEDKKSDDIGSRPNPQPTVSLRKVILVKANINRFKPTPAFWDRRYLGHINLRPLR